MQVLMLWIWTHHMISHMTKKKVSMYTIVISLCNEEDLLP